VKISQVIRRGPAELAGIRPDDVVLKVNGRPVYSRVDLTREIGKIAPGERVRLDLARSDNPVVNVELGKWPVVDDEGIIAPHRRFEPWRGLVVDFSTARHRYWQMGATEIEYPKGVLVTEVFPQSRAALAKLTPGDYITEVNGKAVATPQQFYDVVKSLKGDVKLELSKGQATVRGP
jgi:S1-C subfamily serine protease